MNFTLNNIQWLICHKTKPSKTMLQDFLLKRQLNIWESIPTKTETKKI